MEMQGNGISIVAAETREVKEPFPLAENPDTYPPFLELSALLEGRKLSDLHPPRTGNCCTSRKRYIQ